MTDDAVTDTDAPAARRGQHVRANRDKAFDAALGARIRTLRIAAGMSQSDLGQAVGVSFQQVQKYESGRDRVAAGTLYGFAVALNISPGSLYGDGTPAPIRSEANPGVAVKAAAVFQQIGDARVQKRLVALARVLGEDAGVGKA